MASVLCTGADSLLVATRALILRHAGHNVVTAMEERELLTACSENNFDVAVIGQGISEVQKRRILGLVRQHSPSAKVLELFTPSRGRLLPDADDWLEVPAHVPLELADRVTALAAKTSPG